MGLSLYVSIVIPVYNEAGNLDELIERCLSAGDRLDTAFEIILVDDGSTDQSADIIEAASNRFEQVVGVLLNRNYGQHAAVMAGFEMSVGDVVVTLDADLQNPPEEIPELVRLVGKGYDVVGSVRADRRDTLFRKTASAIINRAVQKATGVKMHDYGCMLRAYRRPIVEAMLQCREHSTFIPVLANSFARSTTEVRVGHDIRRRGHSKYSLSRLFRLMFDLLTSINTYPLRLLSITGGLISLAGIVFGLFLLVMRLAFGAQWAAEGVFTLFAILFIFVGIQFIGMGLLGEYIGRIYTDVRARPRYFVSRVTGKKGAQANSACTDDDSLSAQWAVLN